MTPKYNVTISRGCTAFYTSVNDKVIGSEYDPLPQNELDEFVDYLLSKAKEGIADGTVCINELINLFPYDDFETEDGVCETCGDSVSQTHWKL